MQPGSLSRPATARTLLGMHEVAERLGVKRATVDTWRQRDVLPSPDFDLRGGPVWWSDTIDRWAKRTGRAGPH